MKQITITLILGILVIIALTYYLGYTIGIGKNKRALEVCQEWLFAPHVDYLDTATVYFELPSNIMRFIQAVPPGTGVIDFRFYEPDMGSMYTNGGEWEVVDSDTIWYNNSGFSGTRKGGWQHDPAFGFRYDTIYDTIQATGHFGIIYDNDTFTGGAGIHIKTEGDNSPAIYLENEAVNLNYGFKLDMDSLKNAPRDSTTGNYQE